MTIAVPAPAIRAGVITTITALVALVALGIADTAAAASPSPVRTLAQGVGMSGAPSAQVRRLQRALVRRGYAVGAPGVDGRFGPLTAAAVRRLQAARGLTIDGVVGQRTRKALGLTRPAARAAQERSRTRPAKAPATAAKPSSATPANPAPIVLGPAVHRSSDDTLATVLLWLVIASLAALAAVGAWRHTGRRRRAAGARRPAATGPTREDGPMIGYVPMTPGATSADHDRSSATIVTACQDAGWDLLEIVCDNADGRPLERPGLTHALARIADGEADGLVVSDLRGVSRSIRDLATLIEWFDDAGATLVALDLALDTSTPGGRQAAATLVMVGSPDRDGDGGATDNGHREMRGGGRPAVRDRPELLERIASMRESGMTLREIADQLNAERVPTLRGGSQWRPSSIQVALGYRRPGPRDRLPSVPSRG